MNFAPQAQTKIRFAPYTRGRRRRGNFLGEGFTPYTKRMYINLVPRERTKGYMFELKSQVFRCFMF